MLHREKIYSNAERKASVCATVLFVLFSVLLVCAALRWVGGTVTRSLSSPETEPSALPQQTPTIQHAVSDAGESGTDQKAETVLPIPTESTVQLLPSPPTSSEVDEGVPAEDTERQQIPIHVDPTEPIKETGVWKSGTQYAATFSQEQMDAILVLADEDGMTAAVSILSLQDGGAALVALPCSSVLDTGRLLQSYRADRVARMLSQLIPVEYEQYLVLSETVLRDAVDAVGTLQVAGRTMHGSDVATYLLETKEAPLLQAERFSHVLAAIPEKMRSLSIISLFRLKAALQDAVKTNIEEDEGRMLCNALRVLDPDRIQEYTLPMDSVSVSKGRAYRPNAALAEPMLEELYG